MRGYSMPDPSAVESVDELRDGFEWDLPSTYNIAGEIRSVADERREQPALYHADAGGGGHEFAYRELDAAVARVAGGMNDAGIGEGDRIALCLPPSPEALLSHLAAYRLGAIAVPVSFLYGTETFAHVLSNARVDATWLDGPAHDRFSDTLSRVETGSTTVVDVGAGGYENDPRPLGGLRSVAGETKESAIADTSPETPAIIVNTSGSSGRPKSVVQSHQYLAGTLPGYQLWFELFADRHGERVWTPASWAWAGALFDVVFPTLAMGGTVCSRYRRSGFDPDDALAFLDRARVSRAFFPATALGKIRRGGEPSSVDLSALSVVLVGGEPLAEPLREWAEETLDVRINTSYGLTEANALVGHCRALYPHRAESMGVPYPGHDVDIVDADGKSVEPGERGEIVLQAPDPVLFRGYWRDGDLHPRERDTRFHTDDRAYRDEDGYIYYEGRSDSVIITSGYRVDPREIEGALDECPGVARAVVGGIDDERIGQRIVAYVVPADGGPVPDASKLREHVRETLGKYKAPHEIRELDSIPQTYSGKVDRDALFSE